MNRLLLSILMLLSCAALIAGQTPADQLKQVVSQLQASPNDTSLRERLIKFGMTMKPPPPVPPDAEKFEGRAQYAFGNALNANQMLDAAREYLKAIDVAPWFANYYLDLCKILEKAKRPAEAMRACKFYLAAGSDLPDAGAVRKKIAGFEYGLEQERDAITRRKNYCLVDSSEDVIEGMYARAGTAAFFGPNRISLKLQSVLEGGGLTNRLLIYDFGGKHADEIDLEPKDITLKKPGATGSSYWYRLSISREGGITLSGTESRQPEIVTSVRELQELRLNYLNGCEVVIRDDGRFFVGMLQGGTPARAGRLLFESDCKGNLLGDKPAWLPTLILPHYRAPGMTAEKDNANLSHYKGARADACQESSRINLGWLSP